MFAESLTEETVLESILNANGIKKTIRSRAMSARKLEKLYIIESFTYDGMLIYSKGAIKNNSGNDYFYLLISSKRSIDT